MFIARPTGTPPPRSISSDIRPVGTLKRFLLGRPILTAPSPYLLFISATTVSNLALPADTFLGLDSDLPEFTIGLFFLTGISIVSFI